MTSSIQFISIQFISIQSCTQADEAEGIAEDLYTHIGDLDSLQEAIAIFAEENEVKLKQDDIVVLAKKWVKMKLTDSSDKIPTIPLKDEKDPKTYGKKIRLGIEEGEVGSELILYWYF